MTHAALRRLTAAFAALASFHVTADTVTEWNARANEIVSQSKLGTPPAIRALAIVQTATFEAANAITRTYPQGSLGSRNANDASVEAAIAAANRTALARLLPAQQAAIDAVYHEALSRIPEGAAKTGGVRIGELAVKAVLAARAEDFVATKESYRPHAVPAVYVPTAAPAVPHWPARKPWLMASASQFRPGPPPALGSAAWARDYAEVKELGSRASARRSAAQTEIARFWEYSLPAIYHGVVQSVASQPGRDVTRNARLFAVVAQAMDDAMIAVFDAKYRYNFWRPVTAIRNGDIDGNDATERDASWTPFIDVPMHPEYPSAHAILAGSVGAILHAEIGGGGTVRLSTASPAANGAVRHWATIDEFVKEVAEARVYEGVHYRFSSDIGAAMGRQIGALAVRRLATP
jgi:hypothetical protein